MNLRCFRTRFSGMAIALVLVFGAALVTGTTAQAQGRDRGRDRSFERGRTGERFNRDGRRDQDRDDHDRDRWRGRNWDRDDHRRVLVVPRPYVYTRPYPSYGYGPYTYGRVGGGYSFEEQRGFSDGLNRGQEDARSGRFYNPNNSSHFRSGSAAYRSGFARGYAEGYRQFGGYRR